MSDDWAKVYSLLQMIEADLHEAKIMVRCSLKRVDAFCDRVEDVHSRLVQELKRQVSEFEDPKERLEALAEIDRLAVGGKPRRLQ